MKHPGQYRHSNVDEGGDMSMSSVGNNIRSYGRDIGKGTQGLSMLAWRTASLFVKDFLLLCYTSDARGNGGKADE